MSESCPACKDSTGTHCVHWWDDVPCCWCGDDTKDAPKGGQGE